MTGTSPRRRIVTCQGSIQLITAFSVMRYREEVEGIAIDDYDNYLVIYDLYAPAEQINDFINLIKQIANSLCHWKSIVYIPAENLTNITHKLNNAGNAEIFSTVGDWIGANTASEIYLCRNWQFGNQLLINTYKSANKICYGDSIGIYFSSSSPAFFAKKESPNPTFKQKITHALITSPRQYLRNQRDKLQEWLGLKTFLKVIEFDHRYFSLPDIMGETPPMEFKSIPPKYFFDVISLLTDLVDVDYASRLINSINDSPVAILLTSNFSEAGRITYENEIKAYHRFLKSVDLLPDTVLVIKPHPRDTLKKIQKLQVSLSDLFSKIIVLSEPQLFFLPFEILFLKVFLHFHTRTSRNSQLIKIFAVSSACLSFKLLFDIHPIIGFGADVTSNLFEQDFIDGRLNHERELTAAIKSINAY